MRLRTVTQVCPGRRWGWNAGCGTDRNSQGEQQLPICTVSGSSPTEEGKNLQIWEGPGIWAPPTTSAEEPAAPENAGPAGRPATTGTKAQGRPRWNVLSGKLERLSGQGQGTGGEDALKSLKSSPTSGPGLCLPGSRKGTAAAVRNSKASPSVQPPPPAGPHLSLSNVKRYLRLLVPETKFSECQLQSQYILHSEDQEGGTEGRVDAGKQKQMTECVSQRQQHPLCYLMYLLPDGAGSPLFPSLEPGPTS